MTNKIIIVPGGTAPCPLWTPVVTTHKNDLLILHFYYLRRMIVHSCRDD